jgi:three-Cys-motif partner protein
MSKQPGTVWDLEPHTAKKHAILRQYFQAWLPIMGSWNGRVLYVDGFAGPGQYSKGEDGSPVIVLKAARDHTYKFKAELMCLFVEAQHDRYDHLNKVLAQINPPLPKNIKFQTMHGKFDEHLKNVFMLLQEQKKTIAPALVFIDPFGFSHTPFSTVAKILENPRCEVLVNFMYEEVNRFLSHPDHAVNFDLLFGIPEWRTALEMPTADDRQKAIHDLYLNQLRTVAKYVRSFQMLNMGNRTDYFLFFATNNLKGLEKMKDAMWRVYQSGGEQFSDYKESLGTLPLFAPEPDYAELRDLVVRQFSGRQVVMDALEEFVIADTRFLRTHIRKILIPMENEGSLSVVSAGEKRRRGTFPSGTILQFR